ncbi:hypothetical protein J6590_054807 [Homalodisca vitripennis]|nr:hypothetical protein J6590_054807 [Homalodisca vitripennis]
MATAKQRPFVLLSTAEVNRRQIFSVYFERRMVFNLLIGSGKSSVRPRTSDEKTRIQQAFVRRPVQSTIRASRELYLP